MSALILTQRRDHLFEIVLNRPDKRNAINWQMMTELDAAITEAEKASGIRAVLLRGEGSGFSAGIDLWSFQDAGERFGENWRNNVFPLTHAYQAVVNKFERCSVPVIALLHSYCLGLGFELALACDFRIAAEGTKIGLPEAKLGIIPDVGGTTRLTRLIGTARAKEYVMTGRNLDLTCAEQWGALNAVVTADGLQAKGEPLAAEIAQAAPLAVSYAKRVIDGLADIDRGLQLEAWAQNQLMHSEDFEIGVQAMLQKQPPQWKGNEMTDKNEKSRFVAEPEDVHIFFTDEELVEWERKRQARIQADLAAYEAMKKQKESESAAEQKSQNQDFRLNKGFKPFARLISWLKR